MSFGLSLLTLWLKFAISVEFFFSFLAYQEPVEMYEDFRVYSHVIHLNLFFVYLEVMLFIWNCFIFLRIFPFNPLPWRIPCLTILYLKVCLKQKIKKSLHRPISKAHSTWTEYYVISTTRSEVACSNQICWYNHNTMCECPHWVGHKKCNFHLSVFIFYWKIVDLQVFHLSKFHGLTS